MKPYPQRREEFITAVEYHLSNLFGGTAEMRAFFEDRPRVLQDVRLWAAQMIDKNIYHDPQKAAQYWWDVNMPTTKVETTSVTTNDWKEYDHALGRFTDDVLDALLDRMGGLEKCADYFTERKTDEVIDLCAACYKLGYSVAKTVSRFFKAYPDAKKSEPTPKHLIERKARRERWSKARASRRESIEVKGNHEKNANVS